MSGAKPPQGYETDGHSLLGYLKGGKVPRRGYFCWGLHGGGLSGPSGSVGPLRQVEGR